MEVEEIFNYAEDSDFELDESVLKEIAESENDNGKSSTSTIKEELRFKIQQRRISEGQHELKVEFEPQKTYELTSEEREKIERRKHRNRLSADKSRIKRQRKLENLSAMEKKIMEENKALRAEIDALEGHKRNLLTILNNHQMSCTRQDTRPVEAFTTVSNTLTEVDNTGAYISTKNSGDILGTNVTACSRPSYFVNDSLEATQPKTTADLRCDCTGMELRNVRRTYLSNLSKDEKIARLKAYLKGGLTKPELRNMFGNIGEMTRLQKV